jgi:hypothetical protein
MKYHISAEPGVIEGMSNRKGKIEMQWGKTLTEKQMRDRRTV